ncbi:FG-GAP-like repeat-containing protein [Streptomyces sp. NPDC092046]|uniref:FG-GAP-like repeat-containing protein n=1 Tax=Streptomyces sp. NPDC092046 TaxID=3366009 RepID=UPI003811E309
MRTLGMFRAFVASLAFICAATVLTAPQARAADVVSASTAPPIKTFTYNICGSGGTEGCLVTAAENKARVDTIVAETGSAWNADYVFLVEICSYQYNQLNTALTPRGYTGRYVETVPQAELKGADGKQLCVDTGPKGTTPSYGMAQFVRGHYVDGTDLVLDTKEAIQRDVGPVAVDPYSPEDITAPCIKAWVQNRLTWSCSVHLWWGTASAPTAPTPPTPPATAAQTAAYSTAVALYKDRTARYQVMTREADLLSARAKEWEDAGIPVILSGDFNSAPWGDVLNRFYEAPTGDGAYGGFIEADETDVSDTTGYGNCKTPGIVRCRLGAYTMFDKAHQNRVQKLDYTFFSSRFFRGAVGDVPAEPKVPGTGQWISDHLPLRAAAYWTDCGAYGATPGAVYRRDAAGGLYRYEGRASGDSAALAKPCKVGYGWRDMKHVARQGTTLAAVDAAGVLWHYPVSAVDGSVSGSTRRQVGTGFQNDTLLVAPGDFDGDGIPDLITRTDGLLWLHKGTGADGYAPRTQIPDTSGDWAMHQNVVAGDFAHSAGTAANTPDLVSVDEVGYLWLQEGKGDGTLTERREIASGWGIYDIVAAPGDLDGDGKPDLVARDTARDTLGDLFFFKGDGAGGFAPGVQVGTNFPTGELLF